MSERNRRRGGGRRGPAAVEKPKDFRKAFAQLFRYLGRYKVYLTVMFVCAVAGTVFTIVGPKILGNATTELFHGLVAKVQRTGSINFEKIGRILLTVLILYLVSALFSLLQGLVMAHISNDVSYQLRRNISEKINRIPVEYFESRPYGEVLSRVTNDVDTLQQGINQSITQLITSVTSIIGVFISKFADQNWMMSLPSWGGMQPAQAGQFIGYIIFMFFIAWVAYNGMDRIKIVQDIGGPLLIIIMIALLIWSASIVPDGTGFWDVMRQSNDDALIAQNGGFTLIYLSGLMGNIAFWATMALNIPDFSRYARSQKDQFMGQLLGMPLPMAF